MAFEAKAAVFRCHLYRNLGTATEILPQHVEQLTLAALHVFLHCISRSAASSEGSSVTNIILMVLWLGQACLAP